MKAEKSSSRLQSPTERETEPDDKLEPLDSVFFEPTRRPSHTAR